MTQPDSSAAYLPHGPARIVTDSWSEDGATVEVVARRVALSLDAMERPCADCEVGEPHACPLWREQVVVTYG